MNRIKNLLSTRVSTEQFFTDFKNHYTVVRWGKLASP